MQGPVRSAAQGRCVCGWDTGPPGKGVLLVAAGESGGEEQEASLPSADTDPRELWVCELFRGVAPLWKVTAAFFLLPASCRSRHVAEIALLPLEHLLNRMCFSQQGLRVYVLCTNAERQEERGETKGNQGYM